MFTKNLLGAAEYYQAMSWWYDQLGIFMINKNARADQDVYEVLEGLEKIWLMLRIRLLQIFAQITMHHFLLILTNLKPFMTIQEEGLELLEKTSERV